MHLKQQNAGKISGIFIKKIKSKQSLGNMLSWAKPEGPSGKYHQKILKPEGNFWNERDQSVKRYILKVVQYSVEMD